MDKERFVIDTSVFMSNQIRDNESMGSAIGRLLDQIESAEEDGLEVYMPSSTMEEFEEIIENSEVDQEKAEMLNNIITRKPPTRYEVMIPGEMLYKFVEDMRERVNKGLRISEKAVRTDIDEVEEPEDEYITKKDTIVSDLRKDYKRALRKDIVDSKEDLDILLLARELDAGVVTEDRGIIEWSEDLGVSYMKGRDFPDFLENY